MVPLPVPLRFTSYFFLFVFLPSWLFESAGLLYTETRQVGPELFQPVIGSSRVVGEAHEGARRLRLQHEHRVDELQQGAPARVAADDDRPLPPHMPVVRREPGLDA